jgi:hypothetical protein
MIVIILTVALYLIYLVLCFGKEYRALTWVKPRSRRISPFLVQSLIEIEVSGDEGTDIFVIRTV